ncbi:MAG: aminomethyl-transferring glycine dehydrogenase subunit GcvPB [Acidobacteria bacterium]|nr:aminomethyl-transferring glycine dehydrogenase subunit GcvPB [Acidobacteriota bacterium]
MKDRTRNQPSFSEPLIFERSAAGKRGYSLRPLDVPRRPLDELLPPELRREQIEHFPEVSEVDVIRHFTRLSTWNYSIDLGMYPLGSCTMKYNPKINEVVARMEGFARSHPYQPPELCQGNLQLLQQLEEILAEITGMDAVTLEPAAGAHGELTGLMMIRACLSERGNPRKKVLIPDSAHGTNPASAALCGYQVQTIRSNDRGQMSVRELESLMTEDVACLMLTNPNTLGIFEEQITRIAGIVHEKGGFIYMDGANLNALLGITRPGDSGVDVIHLNLHKTFTTPHGGGGPGAGPVAVKKALEPFLPGPRIVEKDGTLRWDDGRPRSIGRVRAFYGNFLILVRALSYILTCGPQGLKQVAETAVLNANYIRHQLNGLYDLPYPQPTLHEVIFSDKIQSKLNVHTLDIAKRLMDYGFHPPTIYFPLIVSGALMIEPTETESKSELDQFIEALKSIAEEARQNADLLHKAPHRVRHRRFDEVTAARNPVLRWTPGSEKEKV